MSTFWRVLTLLGGTGLNSRTTYNPPYASDRRTSWGGHEVMDRRFRKGIFRPKGTRGGLGEDEVLGFPGDFAISEDLGKNKP